MLVVRVDFRRIHEKKRGRQGVVQVRTTTVHVTLTELLSPYGLGAKSVAALGYFASSAVIYIPPVSIGLG